MKDKLSDILKRNEESIDNIFLFFERIFKKLTPHF